MNSYRGGVLALNEAMVTKRKHELTKNEPRLVDSSSWWRVSMGSLGRTLGT